MLPMPTAAGSSASRLLRVRALAAAFALAMVLGASPGAALADTGGLSPRGHTADVSDGAEPAADPAPAADEYADNDPSALSDFRGALDPHGTWVEDPTYGTVWVPNPDEVGSDFAPYQTAGRWAVDDSDEWVWVSDYDWGYVPFHYGRWVWAGSYWGWIPGRVYAPAWVTWRVGDGGYVGWAPLPPSWYWQSGVAVGLWAVPWAAYCFVPTGYVFSSRVSTYVVRDQAVVHRAASSTRPYHPASPSAGHKAAGSPRSQVRSPSFSAAGVPQRAVPQQRVSTDPRAKAFSKRSSSVAARRAMGSVHRAPAAAASPRADAWHNDYARWTRGQAPPVRAASPHPSNGRVVAAPSHHGGSGHASPRYQPSSPQAPSSHRAPPSFHASAPPAHHAAPSHHAAPTFRSSAPAVRTPSVSGARSVAPSSSRPAAPRVSGGGRGGRRR